jgi:hypothetical protein
MTPPLDDTAPEAMEVLVEIYRRMTPAEKLSRVQDLTLAANQLALAGLRARHPAESEPELLMRLARIRLGDAIVDEVYGARRG